MVDDLGEHCVGVLYHWFHRFFLRFLQLLCIGGLEVLSCLVHVDIGFFHSLGQVLVN